MQSPRPRAKRQGRWGEWSVLKHKPVLLDIRFYWYTYMFYSQHSLYIVVVMIQQLFWLIPWWQKPCTLVHSCCRRPLKDVWPVWRQFWVVSTYIHERPPKPPTCWNNYTRTLILDTIMKLSGTIGVTQKTRTFDTHVTCLPLPLQHTLNPQERWGTQKKRSPLQPRPFADVIGLV